MIIFKLLYIFALVISFWSLVLFIFKRPTFKLLYKYNVYIYTGIYSAIVSYGLMLESIRDDGYFTTLQLVLSTLYFTVLGIFLLVKLCIYIHNRIPDPED